MKKNVLARFGFAIGLWAVILTLLTSAAEGAEYHIDFVNGSDSNSGTSRDHPWQHCPGDIQAATNPKSTTLNPGDSVYFKHGVTYKGSIEIPSVKATSDADLPASNSAAINYKGRRDFLERKASIESVGPAFFFTSSYSVVPRVMNGEPALIV